MTLVARTIGVEGFLACLLLLALPRTARADFFVIPFAGMKFGGSTSIVDLELAAGKKKLVLGVAALKIDNGIIGFEVEFGNIAGYFGNEEVAAIEPLVKPGSYVNDLTGSLVLSLPPGVTGGGLRPYAVDRRRTDSRRGRGLLRSASRCAARCRRSISASARSA